MSQFFIGADELQARLGSAGLRIVDGSWYLPAQNRDAAAEYAAARIPGAVRFDIDAVSDKTSSLPHMLPNPEEFAKVAGAMGISETDEIVVYDGPGVFSSARVWWTFRVMGTQNVRILEGGFDRWKAAGRPVETGAPQTPTPAIFTPSFDAARVTAIDTIRENVHSSRALILDARPQGRFTGAVPEPRPGLRSGHVPGSKSLPADTLVSDGKLKDINELQQLFKDVSLEANRPVITSCGSGVTAAIISLALETVGHKNHSLYDGSWAEWGKADDAPVARWETPKE
ncbi:MAG TPA: 3-mercaptopyruvate sulfurtransferase [Rhizobiaceae bacterium]|nr:3-mercaptopyruvate sulfurtransferase [Rhizobiaceae bacterium]